MRKVKFFLVWGLVLLLSFTACSSTQSVIEESTAETSSSDIFTGTVLEISKYGNTYIDVKSADFLSEFDNGDIVRVSVNGYEITAPVVTSYSDVDNGSPLVKSDGEYVEVALSYSDFASSYSVAVGSVIQISMAEKEGYLSEYEIRHLVKSEERNDYASDEIFANFRALEGGRLKKDFIYRSCNPGLDDARALYADMLAEDAGIRTVINLADNEESLLSTMHPASYYAELYEEGRVILLNMGVDFRSADFASKLAEGLIFMIENPEGPFLIHCNEGKDRAGLVCAILEALAGSSMDEIIEDYMTSYENYYGVEKGSEQYDAISSIIKDFFTSINGRPFPESALKSVAEVYLTSQAGLSSDQLSALEALITQ